MLKQLNSAIEYIEQNLCAKFNIDEAARRACVTTDSFMRFFSYMTGMTLNEYVRRRRLTLAAQDMRHGDDHVIDIAIKYGYVSADAFSRAFTKQRGITLTAYRKYGGSIKVYPPASLHIIIKGAKEMDFRIIELPKTEVYGIGRQFDGQGYKTREELRHIMWSNEFENIPAQLCAGQWNQLESTVYDGVWYGIWQNGRYMIARDAEKTIHSGLEKCIISAGTYAAFRTKRGALAWEEIPKLFDLIFDSWLPGSEYVLRNDDIIEIYHLWTDRDMRNKNRYYEIWIPIKSNI